MMKLTEFDMNERAEKIKEINASIAINRKKTKIIVAILKELGADMTQEEFTEECHRRGYYDVE